MSIHPISEGPWGCSDLDALSAFLDRGRNRYHCAYVVFTDGTYFYAENGTTGVLTYGGPSNAGGVSGTNARDVIQAAVNAPGTYGGKVYIKAGTYTLDGVITLPNFIQIYGPHSRRSTEIGVDLLCGAVLRLTDGTNTNIFENANPTPTGNVGIEINGLYLHMGTQTTGEAINFSQVWRSRIIDTYVRGAGSTNLRGIYLRQACEQDFILGCRVEGAGIAIDNSNDIYVNDFEVGQGGNYGIALTSTCYGNYVSRGYIYNSVLSGIFARNQHDLYIQECYVSDAGEHGIQLDYGVTESIIADNICLDNSQTTPNTHSGIALESSALAYPSTGNIIANNRCYDREAVVGNKTQAYGIAVLSGGGADLTDENLITDNNVFGNRSGGINIATATGPDNTIDRNMGYNPVGVIANKFDNVLNRIEVTGAAATPLASTDYTICHMGVMIETADSGDTNVALILKDAGGTAVWNTAVSPNAFPGNVFRFYAPRNFQLNWGAFTGAAPVVTAAFI